MSEAWHPYSTMVERGLLQFDESLWRSLDDWWRLVCYLERSDPEKYNRTLHLFACGCARQGWEQFPLPIRRVITLSEALWDWITVPEKLRDKVSDEAEAASRGCEYSSLEGLSGRFCSCPEPGLGFSGARLTAEHDVDNAWRLSVIRDIVYNPFRPLPVIDESWLWANDAAVYLLLQHIYYDYRFDLLPDLAAALEMAGCRSEEILDHCRTPGRHFRGCWVADLLLQPASDPLRRILRRAPIPGDRVVEYLLSEERNPFTLYRESST